MLAFALYALLVHLVPTPRIFHDELVYMEAADSLARGDGFEVRGQSYGFGVLYPSLLAAILWIFPDRETAYELAKLLNSLLFALAAIPIYLVGRRLLSPWLSVAVAALSVAVPSSMYASVVMTESVAYLVTSWALLAIILAVEQPTASRQGAAIAAILVGVLARPHLAVLYVPYLCALVSVALLVPQRRAEGRRGLLHLWPTGLSLVLGLLVFLAFPVVRGRSPQAAFGAYEVLWRQYELAAVAKWLVYELANLELYLVVFPIAVAPLVLTVSVASALAGSARHAAFTTVFVFVNGSLLLLAAILDSTEFGLGRLHDRYTFYVVPLWFIVLFAWVQEGAPTRPRLPAAFGAFLAVLLAAVFPVSQFDLDHPLFDRVSTTFWVVLDRADALGSARGALIVFSIAVVSILFLLPRSFVWLVPVGLAWMLVANGMLVWELALRLSHNRQLEVFSEPMAERRWVDERVGSGEAVTTLLVTCPSADLAGASLLATDFFNSSVGAALHVDPRIPDSVLSRPIRVAHGGSLVLPSGEPVVAEYVLAQPGIVVHGRRVAEGTRARLVLWEVDGLVRVTGAQSTAALARAACRNAAS